MQALFATGEPLNPLEFREAPSPQLLDPTDAIIEPIAVAACDLDRSIVSGRSPFPGSFMLGHEFTGRIVGLGENTGNLALGDIVLASFQPSCGQCHHCGHAHSSVCASVPNGTMYGIGETGGSWNGALAERVRVPWAEFNLVKLPAELDPVVIASASDNIADGVRCIANALAQRPDASILIAGSGSIPLYALAYAKFMGVEQITVASRDAFVLNTANQLGAHCLSVEQWPKRFDDHDITVDCTNEIEGLSAVLKSTSPYGHCTSASIFFGRDIPVPMFNLNMRGITFSTGRVNSASAMHDVIGLLQRGFDPEVINPTYAAFSDCISAFSDEPFSRKLIIHSIS